MSEHTKPGPAKGLKYGPRKRDMGYRRFYMRVPNDLASWLEEGAKERRLTASAYLRLVLYRAKNRGLS